MKEELIKEYEKFLNHDKQKFQKARKRIQLLSFLRLLAFLAIVLSFIFFKTLGLWVAISISLAGLILFLYWIKQFILKEKEKQLYANLIQINEDELKAVNEDYSSFDGGKEFIDTDHPFSFDLDVFGEGSIFQFLNRTTTQLGKKRLAYLLQNPETSIANLELKQKALLELSECTRWRQFFAAKGKTNDEDDLKFLNRESKNLDATSVRLIKLVLLIFPPLSFCCIILCSLSIISWASLILILAANSIILFSFGKTIHVFYRQFGNQTKILGNISQLLLLIESKEFNTELLVRLKRQLLSKHKNASVVLDELRKAMGFFDNRSNLFFILTAELFFLADLFSVYRLDKWQKKYKKHISMWFDVLAEFDALSSFANMNHNHPEWALPTFQNDEFHYAANDLGHPLIKSQKRVGNSFQLNGDGKLMIVTGANMAGKSTFLRALGVNVVLALNGCRVCASWMTYKPVGLFSNMRTTDNLQKDESYFFAELLRLQKILDKIRNGKQLFILIDEMLKGTNSQDKLMGSIELVKQLISLDASGVIATHDLELTKVEKDFPQQISNQCFDVKLEENELVFDYKLSQGVTKTMNASFLMKKMGIIPES